MRSTHETQQKSNPSKSQSRNTMPGEDNRQRDAQGRFTDEDNTGNRSTASGRGSNADDQPRDSQGRFKDEDGSSGSRSSRH